MFHVPKNSLKPCDYDVFNGNKFGKGSDDGPIVTPTLFTMSLVLSGAPGGYVEKIQGLTAGTPPVLMNVCL